MKSPDIGGLPIMLHSPGTKKPAAPGIPEETRTIASLMGMQFRWIRGRGVYVAEVPMNGQIHMFEADPKMISSDEKWMEWIKTVADWLSDKGHIIKELPTSRALELMFAEKIKNEEEQNPTAG